MRNNIDFGSTQYVQVGATNKNCLKVLPAASKKTQEFVVGDHTGTLSIFEFNKGEISVESKTATPAKEISRIELVGSNYLAREKIYYSAGTFIRGFTRKGKETYKVDTYLTETIKSFAVEENRMWTAGEYFLNEYDAGKDNVTDRSSLLCPDKINDLFIHHITSPSSYNAILACQDKGIRVVDEGNIAYSFMAQGAVNCINPFSETAKFPQTKDQLDKTLLFGLSDGTFINVMFEPERPVFVWSAGLEDKRKAGIALTKVYDFQGKGINDIIVVRDDSTIELFSLNSDQQYESQYSTTLYEGVTGIDAGQISVPGVNEFIISSYSGKITGYLDNEEVNKIESKKPKENPKDTEKKIKSLRAEIDKLKQDVDKLKAETPAETAVSTATNSFKVNHKIVRNSHDASYSIHIESQYPIEIVIIQSMVTIELIEVDSNIAILSLASEDPDQNYALAGTYRFIDANILKFELKLRTVEGQYGDLNCFVIPHANPKTCQAFSVPLKPLSLHERYLAEVDTSKLNCNRLRISGEFRKHEIHSWIAAALPDFPPNIDDDETVLSYRSSFVGTFLVITYGKGKAVFDSESISAISILKDVISQEASTRGVHINIQWDTNDQSIKRVLELLKPKFDYYQSITRRYQVLTALKEISNQEGNANFLSKDSREILESADEITNAFKQQPRKLQYLKGIVTDLYADRAKSKGVGNVSGKISQLVPLLNNFNIEPLVQFFMNN